MKNLTISGKNKKVTQIERLEAPSNRQSNDSPNSSTDDRNGLFQSNEIRHVYKVEISLKSILLVAATIGAIYLGYKLLQVALVLFFAFVIASALMPLIRALMNQGLPKWLSMMLIYLFSVLLIFFIIFVIVVPFAQEISHLVKRTPEYISHITENLTTSLQSLGLDVKEKEVNEAAEKFYSEQLAGGVLFDFSSISDAFDAVSVLGAIVGGFFLSLVISIYIVYDHDSFLDFVLLQIVNNKKRTLVKRLIIDMERKLGGWIVGQGAVSSIIALLSWILLAVLQVPFALPLALLAGLLVAVPTIGFFLSAVPALVIAFLSGGIGSAIAVAIGYTVIQQIENAILVPKIMGNVVGVKPIVVLVGVLVSLSLGGVAGAIITVPLLVIGKICYDFYLSYRKIEAME